MPWGGRSCAVGTERGQEAGQRRAAGDTCCPTGRRPPRSQAVCASSHPRSPPKPPCPGRGSLQAGGPKEDAVRWRGGTREGGHLCVCGYYSSHVTVFASCVAHRGRFCGLGRLTASCHRHRPLRGSCRRHKDSVPISGGSPSLLPQSLRLSLWIRLSWTFKMPESRTLGPFVAGFPHRARCV